MVNDAAKVVHVYSIMWGGPSAATSATLLPRPPSRTRCWTTRSPTPRSAPPADAATKRPTDYQLGRPARYCGTPVLLGRPPGRRASEAAGHLVWIRRRLAADLARIDELREEP
ncbi:hypothetical protein [Planotetraspora sp. GP83]|uniref:hypothetical protein n=1 Tax=Planotetraspora sp. GP83 TaxID=3156264 RepID=UPI003511886F